ncbi:hypothetical protein QNH20_14015 [Neobacillus sp. WH10]|uniref:hypothetical protein n=1 Tax=Neobacillus sp. WH10 TaxID=3047873 RepID=UPI0024C15649|nr:hypothetical protein [Neobacillus sp. WH10]WHY75266.1 hypothetical protein QNH20_14015 [Neobacillus sp. WH10]
MYWETLPNWFWIIYYLFLFTTLGTAIFSVTQKKIKGLSILTIVFTLTIPIVSLINGIERMKGLNEFEHLVGQLQQGAFWSIFIIIGVLYILFWWVIFLLKNMNTETSY